MGVRLLGRFGVTIDGREIDAGAWPTRRAVQLVTLLALSPNCRLTTEQVMDALWPDLDPQAARANLHKAASHARRAMDDREAVVLRGGSVALWPAATVEVDAVAFQSRGRAAVERGTPDDCGRVADECGGELLPDEPYEEWAAGPREQVRRLHLDLLRRAERWADVVEADPIDEAAHVQLMRHDREAGRLHAAVRQFQRLRAVLARELGVPPGPEATALYRDLIGSTASGWIRPSLAGREVELVRARAALRRAAEGRPAAVLVTGPAGIGKTRLCEELVDQAGGAGWLVVRAMATEHSAALPYGPLAEALDALLLEEPGLGTRLDGSDRSLLARLTRGGSGTRPTAATRHAVLRLVNRVVAASGRTGAVLFIDDLHLADEATIGLAHVAASAPPPRGVLFIASYRPAPSSTALNALTTSLVAGGTAVEIELGPLSKQETRVIVSDVAGRTPTPDETGLAWELSEGNPFFALEIASTLASDEPVSAAAGVSGAVAARLQRLPLPVRLALRSVALVTDEFDTDDIAALGTLSAQEATAAIDTATAAGVVARSEAGNYRFRHSLVRDALGRDATDAERTTAHAATARRLIAAAAPPGAIARHLIASGQGREALPFLRSAAREAIEVGAHADALVLADQALGVEPGDPEALALRADALHVTGDPGAVGAYAVAMAVAQGPARSALAVRRARALVLAGEIPGALEMLETVGELDPGDRVQHLVTKGLAVWCAGALDEAELLSRQARDLAEETANLRDFVDATMLTAMVAHERGAWPQRASLDLLDTQLRPDLASVVIDAHLCVAESYLYGGVPYSEVVNFATDLRDGAKKRGVAQAEAFATTLLGEAHLLMGDAGRASDLLAEAAQLHRRVGVLCGEALSLQRLAEALFAGGIRDRAHAALADALAVARGSPVGTRHLLDRVHGTAIRAATDPADATEAVLAVNEARRGTQGPLESCPPCSVNLTIPAAIALATAQDPAGARNYLAAAEQVVAAFYPRGVWHAALDEARGHVARAEGDEELASRLLARAAEGFEHWGQPLDAGRCRAAAVLTAGKV